MSDRKCLISISRDGGHTFGSWSEHDLGETGDFMKRVVRRRLGISRHMVMRIRVTSPVRSDLIAASADITTEQ